MHGKEGCRERDREGKKGRACSWTASGPERRFCIFPLLLSLLHGSLDSQALIELKEEEKQKKWKGEELTRRKKRDPEGAEEVKREKRRKKKGKCSLEQEEDEDGTYIRTDYV